MDVHAYIIQILQALIGLTIVTLAPLAGKFLLSKTSAQNLQKFGTLAKMVVTAVEQTMPDAANKIKKATAESKLAALTKGVLSEDDISHLVESAVFNMKQEVSAVLAQQPVTISGPTSNTTATADQVAKASADKIKVASAGDSGSAAPAADTPAGK